MNKIKKKKTIEHIVKKEIKPNAKIQSHEVFYLLLIVVLVSTISIIFQYARTDLVGEAKLAVEEGKFTEVDIGEGVEEAIPVTQSVIEIQDGFNEKLESTKLEKKDEDWADTSISVDEDSKGRSIGSSIVLKNIKSLNEKTEFKVDYLRKPISKIKTQVISYEPQGDEEFTAEVTLAKENLDDIITTIYRCPSEVFDHENMRCEEDDFWQATSIIPTDNKDGTISFTVDSFSASGGGDDGEPLAGPGDYPTLNPGDVIVDQDYVGSESGYYTDFSEGFADLSGSGGTMYIYDGVYREHQQMFKDGHWSIKGMEHTDQTIFTAAREVTEADFTTSPYTNIYRVALADISGLVPTPSADAVNPGDYYLRAGVVDITDGIMLRQVPLSQLIDASGCPPAFAVDDTYLYVYLSPADPTQHELEIMNANDVYPGILQPGDIDGRISFTNMTFRATGMARDGRTFYFFAGGYPSNLPELYFENFVYSMNDMPLIRASFVYNLTLINVTVPPNHNQNRRMPDVDLFNIQSETYDGEERHYVIKDSEFGPHAFIGQLRLKNSASTALVDGVTLITAGQHPHSGIDVRSDTVPPLTPGKLTIRNSIFASWDHTSAELQADPVYCQETQVWGYDGGWRWLADNQDDAVSDFLFSETRTIFDVTLENNLFAYSHFATYLQDANQGSIMQGKNNIFINSPPTFSAIAYGPDNQVEVPYWDYNLYYNTGDDPYTPGVMRIDGTEYSTLPQIQAGWQSYVLGNDNNDQHSMVAAPELTNWMKNDDLVYDFTPSSSSSNVCGAGEGGEDIGPIPCPTGGDVCAGTDVDCGVNCSSY